MNSAAAIVLAGLGLFCIWRGSRVIWCLSRHYPFWSRTRHGGMCETYCPNCNRTWWEPR